MQRIKLPSGTIVDVDAVSRISPPDISDKGFITCNYTLGGRNTVAHGADADPLYAAVDALVCNQTPADSDGAAELRAIIDDVLENVRGALVAMNEGRPVDAADILEGTLNEYAPLDSEPEHGDKAGRYSGEAPEVPFGDAPGDDMIATHREAKRRMAVTHSLYESEGGQS